MAAQPPRPSVARSSVGGAASSHGANDAKVPGTFFLGRYRVVEEIGIGGMASVHLARMDGPGGFQKWVAIKRIHPNLVEDDQFVDMFLDEARIAAGINHANVAQVFDLGKDDNTYWIAMEYLHGEPLREVMRRCEERSQLISPDLAARICADAAEGLHAAHELRGKSGQLLGLVHRDVTPHNLFITYDGYTKVVDFGIAKVADRLSETRAGTLKGKLAYMSPEQVRAQDDVDRTTDIFALGVVLWELTTGHRLFRMDTDLDTLEKVQACVVPPPSTMVPGYPIELESVVMKALAKKKAERFQTARELSRALQTYLLRRGVFVGPEEVAAFVRELFGDRIRSREDHLAWAADVTSTINIDQLKGVQLTAREEASKASSSTADEPLPPPPRPSRGPMPPPSGDGLRPGRHTVPMSAPQGSSAMVTKDSGRAGIPEARGSQQGSNARPQRSSLASTSLVDDDEDVPTTVAAREHMGELLPKPPPAPSRLGPGAQGMNPRTTTMGLGATMAMNPSTPQRPGGAPSGPPPALAGAAGPQGNRPPSQPAPSFGPPIAFGPPPSASPGSAARSTIGGLGAMNGALPAFGPPPGGMQQQQQQQQQNGGVPQAPGSQPGTHGPQGHPSFYPTGPQQQQQQQQHGLPPGAFATGASMSGQFSPGQQQQQRLASGVLPSHVETALSLPRPNAAQLWMLHQDSSTRLQRKNTAILIAVAVLTAVCVAAICALIYFKYRSASVPPSPDEQRDKASLSSANPVSANPATGPPPTTASPSPTSAPSEAPSATSTSTADVAPSSTARAAAPTTSSTSQGTSPGTAAGGVGYLTVICKPFCDNVKRNGSSLGSSPIVKSPTPPGTYRITLTRAGSPDRVESVTVTSGDTAVVRENMK